MDSEQRNQTNEHNPAQSELDFGTNERITPKKFNHQQPSALDKIRAIFAKKESKENLENKFSERKTPAFPPVQTESTEQSAVENSKVFGEPELAESETENLSEQKTFENPTAPIATPNETNSESTVQIQPKASLKNPENWAILKMLPQKHRRLFVALLALVLLLIFFFIMKPSSDTVQSFEQQNNEVPIQFQSLDQSQPSEINTLDAINPTQTAQEQTATVENSADNNAQTVEPLPQSAQQTAQTVEQIPSQPNNVAEKPTQAAQTQNTAQEDAHKLAQEKARQERLAQEKARAEEKAKADKARAEKAKAEEHAKLEKARAEKARAEEKVKAEKLKAEQAAKNKATAPVVDAKPTHAAASKTLTVPQGVSLMQVFRDNNLNIADVNAMTKANGVGNALSSFKPGDKVQVSLNPQGRVSELRLSNGARFIRQADGSYQFKK